MVFLGFAQISKICVGFFVVKITVAGSIYYLKYYLLIFDCIYNLLE